MGEAFLMGYEHGVDVSEWKLVDYTVSNMNNDNREVSVELNDEDTFLIVCNCGVGEGGDALTYYDPDFISYASTFLVHKGNVIFGVKQKTGYERWYNSLGSSVDTYSDGSIITSEATIVDNVFLYQQPNLIGELGTDYSIIYTYSVWKLI